MIMEHHAGDHPAAPCAAGEPRSRLHSSNGPPHGGRSGRPELRRVTPPVPQGRARGRGLAVPGLQRRRAVMVAARARVTSTMVSCCCPGSYNKASSRYLAARGTAETAQRCCNPERGPPGPGPRGRTPGQDQDPGAGPGPRGRIQGLTPGQDPGPGPPGSHRQPARAPARRTRRETWILTPAELTASPPEPTGINQAV
jgi:hypothetical protein